MALAIEPVPWAARAEDIEPWLSIVRRRVQAESPQSLDLFDVFANEARFAHAWLRPSIASLAPGASILEVGAGLGLLSCQLARQGFRVVALEPIAEGFSSFSAVQRLVLDVARTEGHAPEILAGQVEVLDREDCFDLAFSVNVMEHVDDVGTALHRIGRALRRQASYRFTCPNYSFPYEPHFNIPTLVSKRLTERLFRRRILTSTRVQDQEAVWRSLNWITVGQIRRIVRREPGLAVRFDTAMLVRTFERLGSDGAFASRRSRWLVGLARWLVASRLHRVFAWIPASLQPIIDCQLTRQERHALTAGGSP